MTNQITAAVALAKIEGLTKKKIQLSVHGVTEAEAIAIVASFPKDVPVKANNAGSSEYITIDQKDFMVAIWPDRGARVERPLPTTPVSDLILRKAGR